MLLNYIKLAVRLLIRNPFFTVINVLGLAIGFTTFFALWQYSVSELTKDQQYKDHERIGRIGFELSWMDGDQEAHITFSASKASLPPLLKLDFPEIENYVRISEQDGFFQNDLHHGHGTRIVMATMNKHGNEKIFKETKLAYADRNVFQFFGIPLLSGDPEKVLSGINFIALSKSSAQKYFGDDDPIGQQLIMNDTINLYITGVYEDMPHNSRLDFDMIISNEGLLTKWSNVYWGGTQNLIKVREGSLKEFENKLRANTNKYWAHILSTCNGCKITPFVQPLKEIAFSQGLIGDDGFHRKSKSLLITLGGVAVVVLVMAWINYVNLTLSRLSNRMKEFAARRVNGAGTKDLVLQFLAESTLINFFAVGVAITAFQIIRSPLAIFLDIHIADIWSVKTGTWIPLALVILSGILVTGLYPAYVCARQQPRSLLTSMSMATNKNIVSRFLTIFQFAAAIVLILWAFVIYHQLNFIMARNTGYNRDGIVTIEGPVTRQANYQQSIETLADRLMALQNVKTVTMSRYGIGEPGNKPGNITKLGTTISIGTECNAVDENFIPLFGLKMIAGRNFVKDEKSDAVIISRPNAKALGFENPEDAIGLKVTLETGDWGLTKQGEVIGVIEDYRRFPFFDLSESNTIYAAGGHGIFLTYKNKLFPELVSEKIAVSIEMKEVNDLTSSMELIFRTRFPGDVFEWQFLDDRLNQAYSNERFTRNQILIFTILAIGISCLGLIAMMNQRINEKTKEIGIRKILGAKSSQIGKLLVYSTILQVLTAALIGIPIAYYLAEQYLQKYAERISLAWWYYLMPVGILMVIMFSTISTMLLKAVRTNPVESLRYE